MTALPLLPRRLRHHLLSGSQFLPLSGGEIMVPVGAVGVTGIKEKNSVNKTGGGWGCLCCLDPGGVPRALYSLTPSSGAIMIVSERRRTGGVLCGRSRLGLRPLWPLRLHVFSAQPGVSPGWQQLLGRGPGCVKLEG